MSCPKPIKNEKERQNIFKDATIAFLCNVYYKINCSYTELHKDLLLVWFTAVQRLNRAPTN